MDVDNTTTTVANAVSASTADAPLRVFTLGIGDTVSTAMCEGIARAGNGLCLLAVSSESIVGKCARLLRAGRSSILKDVSIDWGVPSENTANGTARFVDISSSSTVQISPAPAVQQTPHHIHNIDPGMRFIVFMITTHKTVPTQITVRGRLDGTTEQFTHSVPVEYVNSFRKETSTIPLVHTLAARRLIVDFEDDRVPLPTANAHASIEDIRKAVIVRLGEEYQLASKYTSFVAVEEATQSVPDRGIRSLRGRSLRLRPRPINPNEESGQGSFLENIIGGALTLLTYAMSYFQGTISRGRSSWRVPGAFPGSRSASLSPPGSRDQNNGSFSTLSSLDGSRSAWSTSRTPSPSPSPSVDAEHERSPSPVLEDLHQAPEAIQRQHGFEQGSTIPSNDAGGPVSPQIFNLVQLQSFDGSFPLNNSLGQIVGHDAMGKAAEFQVDDKIWATALAVAFLRKHLSKQPDLLEGLLDKAMEFARNDANFDSLVVRAKALVG